MLPVIESRYRPYRPKHYKTSIAKKKSYLKGFFSSSSMMTWCVEGFVSSDKSSLPPFFDFDTISVSKLSSFLPQQQHQEGQPSTFPILPVLFTFGVPTFFGFRTRAGSGWLAHCFVNDWRPREDGHCDEGAADSWAEARVLSTRIHRFAECGS